MTLIVLLFAPLVKQAAMPSLAALLIVAGFQGLRTEQAIVAWKTGRVTAVVMIITFIGTLFISLQFAVLLGVALSIVLHVVRASNKVAVTEWVLQPQGYPIEQQPPMMAPSNRLTLLNIDGSLFFAAASNIKDKLPDVDESDRAVVAIMVRGQSDIGSTFLNVIQEYAKSVQARNGRFMLIGIDPKVYDQLAKTGLLKIIGEENVFLATPQLGEALNRAIAEANTWLESPTET